MNNLAFLYHDRGDAEAAIALARESLAIKRAAYGNEHPEVARSLNVIAMWSMEEGDYAAAEPMLSESLAMNEKLLGREHPDVAGSLTLLASCLVGREANDEALALAIEARAIFTQTLPENHWRTAVATNTEGAALAGLRRYAEAEPLLVASHDVLSKDESALALFVVESTRRLEALYAAWGKPDKAAQYRAMLN